MFSKQVIVDIIKTLPNNHTPIETFLMSFDLDDKIDLSSASSVLEKKNAITKFLIANQDLKDQFSNNIVLRIVEDRINNHLLSEYEDEFDTHEKIFKSFPYLYKYLRYDGYDIENGKLIRTLPEDFNMAKKEDEIIFIIDKYGFATAKGHLNEAKSNYLNGNCASVNSQLRTYVESLFEEMAAYIKKTDVGCAAISAINPSGANSSMQILAKCSRPILDTSLNEWDGQRKGFIEGFWNRLHPMGCHPGLPDIDEATFRFQLVLLTTYNLIRRFSELY